MKRFALSLAAVVGTLMIGMSAAHADGQALRIDDQTMGLNRVYHVDPSQMSDEQYQELSARFGKAPANCPPVVQVPTQAGFDIVVREACDPLYGPMYDRRIEDAPADLRPSFSN